MESFGEFFDAKSDRSCSGTITGVLIGCCIVENEFLLKLELTEFSEYKSKKGLETRGK